MAKGDQPLPVNDGNEKQNLTHHDGFSNVQDQAFLLLEKATTDRHHLSHSDQATLAHEARNMSPEQYSAVVAAAFTARKEEFQRLPSGLKESFAEWVDHFDKKADHPAVKAMNKLVAESLNAA